MNNDNGALEFEVVVQTEQMKRVLEETKRRIQGFTDATVEGGERMEAAYKEAAAQIEAAFKDIDTMAAIHSNAIADLEKEYARLGEAAGSAFAKGTAKGDDEYRALTQKQQAIQQEIATRKQLLNEVGNTADALQKEEVRLKETKRKVDENSQAQVTFRTQLRNAREELTRMEQAGLRGTAAYSKLQQEVGRLKDAMDDANQQAKVLANDEAAYQGVISAVSGIAGAFSAAQGAIGLFADENENLQRIMVKVQSLMAITIGLQQVAQTLNKDSAFRLKTLVSIQNLYSTAIRTTGTALIKFGASAGVARVAATALMATLTLGLSVAITAIVVAFEKFRTKTQETKKSQEEFNKKVADAAGKPIATINELSYAWGKLGDNIKDKEKFIEDNKDKFDSLGVSVKNAAEAEKLLIDNKKEFIESQILKAKAMAATELAAEEYKKALEKSGKLGKKQPIKYEMPGALGQRIPIHNPAGLERMYGKTIDEMLAEGRIKISSEWKNWDTDFREANDLLTNAGATYFKMAAEFTAKEQAILASLGQSANNITDGSIAALEESISKLREKWRTAVTDADRTNYIKQIRAQEKLLAKIDAPGKKTSGDTKQADPFTEQLEARKKQYQEYSKWINSANEDIRTAAKAEFANLIKEGENYGAYLKNLKTSLEALPASANRDKQIAFVTTEIVSTEKSTYIDGYKKDLEEQLALAGSLFEKLNLIADKRKELDAPGVEMKSEKSTILDAQQGDIVQQTKDELQQAKQAYSDYLAEKVSYEVRYWEKRKALELQIEQETDEGRKQIYQDMLNTLNTNREFKYSVDYDALVDEYKTYQQKCADISAGFDEKIALATQQKNEALVATLQEAKANALSSAAFDELQNSDLFQKLFGNLDNLTVSELIKLRNTAEDEWSKIKLSPKEFEALRNKISEVTQHIQQENPFAALVDAVKRYKDAKDDATKKDALKDTFKNVAASADIIKGSFDSVTGALANMGLAGDEVTQQLLGDISNMLGSVSQLATGIVSAMTSGNPLGIIQGSMGLISSLFNIFNFRDRAAERAIKKHATAVKELERAYKALEYAVNNALGETVYDNQKSLINNMKEQQAHLQQMAREEEGKKKTDHDKVKEYQDKYEELGRSIQDVINEIAESVTQTSAKDLAKGLADAIAETFTEGFDSERVSSAIDKVTTKVMQNAVKNALTKSLLEIPLANVVKQLQRDMGFDDEGGGSFDGLTPEEQQRFKDRAAAIAASYTEAMKVYEDLFKDLGSNADPTTSLSGAIKGASQESIDLLAGQTNAVRVNQVEGIEIMRQQLIHLANIDGKLGVSNRHLEQIEKNTANNTADPLRAKGIIY